MTIKVFDTDIPRLTVTRAEFDARCREAGWQDRTIELLHVGRELRSWVVVGNPDQRAWLQIKE
jgi:hypothetical protein